LKVITGYNILFKYLETIRKVKADRYPAFRPSLNTNTEIHSEIFALIKDCWSEVASERPAINEIREMLSKRFRHDKYTNLMDHVKKSCFP
jgi:hypothetical protein